MGEDSLPDVSGTAPEVFEWDVVQFRMELPSEPALVRLGRVVSVADETCTVEPMAEQVIPARIPSASGHSKLKERWHSGRRMHVTPFLMESAPPLGSLPCLSGRYAPGLHLASVCRLSLQSTPSTHPPC